MGIFDYQKQNGNGHNPSEHVQEESVNGSADFTAHMIPEKTFIEKEPIHEKKTSASYKPTADNNINILFSILDKNHEQDGYDDALVNPDSSHLEQNIEALRNDLTRTIRKVKTYYEDFLREIDFHILTRSTSGMLDTVAELEMKKSIVDGHLLKVKEIETDAKNNTGESQGVIISYTRGFKNGLSAISHHSILKRNL